MVDKNPTINDIVENSSGRLLQHDDTFFFFANPFLSTIVLWKNAHPQNLLYRVKVYSNECSPWSKLCVAKIKLWEAQHQALCIWREGYLLPTLARKITPWWRLELSVETSAKLFILGNKFYVLLYRRLLQGCFVYMKELMWPHLLPTPCSQWHAACQSVVCC